MSHQANLFRLVHRSFDRVIFDRIKSDSIFALRGFDLGHAGEAFPGYVLERPATPHPAEARFQVLTERTGAVLLLSYTRLGRTCKLLSGWVASPAEAALWWGRHGAPADAAAPTGGPGRCDPARLGSVHAHDSEPRPEIAVADLDASMEELATLRRRMMGREPAL